MYRLVAFLQKELRSGSRRWPSRGTPTSASSAPDAPAEERLPYLVVLLDRWEGFIQAFESLDGGVLLDRVTALLQEGAGVGIRVVMTRGPQRPGRPDQHADRGPDRAVDERPGRLRQHRDPGARGAGRRCHPGARSARASDRARCSGRCSTRAASAPTRCACSRTSAARRSERYADLPRSRRPQRVDDLPADGHRRRRPASSSPASAGDTLRAGRRRRRQPWRSRASSPDVGGNGFMITGPPRSGKSNALQFMLAGCRGGCRSPLFVPRRSPLLTDPPRGATVLTGSEPVEEITAHLDKLRGDQVIAVDDFEVIGARQPARPAAHRALRPDARHRQPMFITGAIDDMLSVYRGLPNELKRGRSGLILAPRASNDGDVAQRPPPPLRLGRDAGRPRRPRQPPRLDLGAGPPDCSRVVRSRRTTGPGHAEGESRDGSPPSACERARQRGDCTGREVRVLVGLLGTFGHLVVLEGDVGAGRGQRLAELGQRRLEAVVPGVVELVGALALPLLVGLRELAVEAG